MGYFSADPTGVGVLTWHKCRKRMQMKWKKDRVLAHETEIVCGPGESYALRYHRTNILTFWPDGRVDIDDGGYGDNRSTQLRINEHQDKVNLFNATCKYANKVRFWKGYRYPPLKEAGYPWPGRLSIVPGEAITGLVDTVYVQDPTLKKERAAKAKEFRRIAGPRLLLGGFDEEVLKADAGGFRYYRPRYGDDEIVWTVVEAFLKGAPTSEINAHLEFFNKVNQPQVFGRPKRWVLRVDPTLHPTRTDAINAFINYLLRHTILEPVLVPKKTHYPAVML